MSSADSESWARLRLVQGESPAQVWELVASAGQTTLTVGLSPGCNWVVREEGVAPIHFSLHWDGTTLRIADTYAAGVQQAIGRGAFQKGVTKAGPAKYQTNASTKGANHYPEGIRSGAGPYQQNAAPYFDALSGIVYPPRRPRGDPANQARSIIVQTTLHTKRVGG